MKKRLLVFLAVLLVLAACTPGALAYDVAAEQAEDFGTASLEYALPEQAYDAFGALSVADAAQPQSLLTKLWAYVLHEGGGAVASAARNAALLLAVVFLSALCASISVSGACGKVTQMAGTVAVAALSVTHVTSCITAGSEALATLRDFSKILLPSMCAAAAASGAATSAAAKYAATSLFLDVLLSAETAVLLPLAVTGCYLLLFRGTFVRADMRGDEMFSTLSAGIAFTGIAAGFVDEMVFRGVILNLFAQRWNKVVAVIVPSLLFGIVHILGADFTFGSCLLVILTGTMVGVMFSLIALQSGSVWNSGIVHAIWNIVIIGGGLSIGETADAHAIASYVLDTRSFAVTGGQFGIEASVISLAGYCIVAVIAYAQLRADNAKRS